jgi:hypothetical protein
LKLKSAESFWEDAFLILGSSIDTLLSHKLRRDIFWLFLDVGIRVKNTITKIVFKIPWCFSLLWSWEFFWCRNCSNWEQVGTPCTTKWRLEHPPTGKKLITVNEILLSFRFDALTKKCSWENFRFDQSKTLLITACILRKNFKYPPSLL